MYSPTAKPIMIKPLISIGCNVSNVISFSLVILILLVINQYDGVTFAMVNTKLPRNSWGTNAPAIKLDPRPT